MPKGEPTISIRLVVFLGNPGKQYAATRHNVARILLDHLSFADELSWNTKFKARIAEHRPQPGEPVRFLVPDDYMNRNGISVALAAQFYKLEAGEILVAHDDLELPFGRVAIRTGGGLGGHNGLRSVSERLGTREFQRLRIGIGRPPRGSVQSYVLSRFTAKEEAELGDVLAEAAAALSRALGA